MICSGITTRSLTSEAMPMVHLLTYQRCFLHLGEIPEAFFCELKAV
jgi:hypothetical protein